ncbi:MAG: hypothetical protein EOM14_00905 [Clostridia bacterium]|nr:hypothetical protein [Clostridia bacterium]
MRQKTSLVFCAALLLLVFLSGCGQSEDESDATPTDVSAAPQESADPQESDDPQASPENTDPLASPESTEDQTMTLSESVDFINSLSPSTLGLQGKNMSEYNVYAEENSVLVDGNTCAKIMVYCQSSSAGTNVIQGIYFLSRDGDDLYRLNTDTDEVSRLDLPYGV